MAGSEKSIFIDIRNAGKTYGKNVALRGISAQIFKGEIFGFVGPNGAGKSTLVSLLTTLVKPDKGDITVGGFSVLGDGAKVRHLIGFVPQDVALYPSLSGYDNLKFWGGLYGLKGSLLKERVDEALGVVAMKDRAHDKVEEYSGGMKRRINIGAALLHHPEVLIMDEPTAGVDFISSHYIIEAVKNLKNKGRTVIYTSHDIEEMEKVCDRIAILSRGEILKTGYVKDLVDEANDKNLKDIVMDYIVKNTLED